LYQIPVISTAAIKQQKAAKYIHLCSAFLMMANAWGVFNSSAHPNLIFIVSQIAVSLMTIAYVLGGKKLFPKIIVTQHTFRIAEIISLAYAAYHFYSELHLHLMSLLQAFSACGLFYLLFNEQKAFKKQLITIKENGIRLPMIENKKLLPWKEIDNLRIRNDYISINTISNRFIQYETATTYNESDLDKMNAWCFQQISAVHHATDSKK
jgi:hypothetical protein